MKRVVSVSLGSSKRDHRVRMSFHQQVFEIQRIGTDGSMLKAIALVNSLRGKVDAFGMGGIDLYVWAGKRRYVIRDAEKIKAAAGATPMVDGSGLKNTLEGRVINYLQDNNIVNFRDKKVLITSAMDRYGMADAIKTLGGRLVIGDLMFALGVDVPIYTLKTLQRVASLIAPIVCRLPFNMLYPTGDKQRLNNTMKLRHYYDEADVIAGDFHYIRRYMPNNIKDKVIITNTVTKEDVELLKERGASLLVTTTPELEGRSFGTNVMEAMLVAILRDKGMQVTEENYLKLIAELNLRPRVEYLDKSLLFSHLT